jgi:hypothetical protein
LARISFFAGAALAAITPVAVARTATTLFAFSARCNLFHAFTAGSRFHKRPGFGRLACRSGLIRPRGAIAATLMAAFVAIATGSALFTPVAWRALGWHTVLRYFYVRIPNDFAVALALGFRAALTAVTSLSAFPTLAAAARRAFRRWRSLVDAWAGLSDRLCVELNVRGLGW